MRDDEQASDGAEGYPSIGKGVFLVCVLVLGYMVSLIDRQVMALLIGPIQKYMGVRDFEMSLLVGFAFAIFFSVFGLPLGRVADRVNRKRLIAAGMILWSLATILCGLATSFAMLFLCRILVGVGEATYTPAAYSMLSDAFPPRRLARATAIVALGGTLGSGLALVVGGFVIDHFTNAPGPPLGFAGMAPWQATFIVVGLPGFVVAALVMMTHEPARRGRIRGAGAKPIDTGAFRLLWARRRDYLPFYAAGMGLATVTYSGYSWFPTHMIRTFGLPAGEAGKMVGLIQVSSALCGALFSVLLVEYLLKRGRHDAHLLAVGVVALGVSLTLVAPLMPTIRTTLAMWFVSSLLQHSYYGTLMAGMQIITPGEVRGANVAMYLLFTTLIGLGGGAALVGAISQHVFAGDPRGIGYGIAIVGVAASLFASAAALAGLGNQRRIAAAQLNGAA